MKKLIIILLVILIMIVYLFIQPDTITGLEESLSPVSVIMNDNIIYSRTLLLPKKMVLTFEERS